MGIVTRNGEWERDMKKWENLPEEMRNQEVLYYYEVLKAFEKRTGCRNL